MQNTNLLKRKTVSGLLWSFIDLFAGQGIQFIVLIIMARLLSPEYFGIIGIVAVFIAISNSIIDSGFSQALIREKHVSQADYSTVFFFNMFMSVIIYITIYLSSPFISNFFREEQLTQVLRILTLAILITSLGMIQRVMLMRNINFKTQTTINLISAILSGGVAITLAVKGFGVWSLVFQTLTMQLTQTILLWFSNKWMPSLTFSVESFKRLFSFGYKLLISGLIDTVYSNVFSVVIGRLYTTVQLGLYTNAGRLTDVVSISTTNALQRVSYPVLSTIQDDEKQLKYAFQKLITTTAYVMFPLMIGLIAISDSFIPLIFGPKWVDSIIYFKLLAIAGMLYPLHALNLNILKVKGRSDLFLRLEIIKKALFTILIATALYFSLGIIGLIVAGIISSYLSLFINAYYSAREVSYSISQQIKDIVPSFLISIFMGIVVYMVGTILPEHYLFKLCIQIIIGILLYAFISRVFKLKEFDTVIQIILQFLQKAKATEGRK